MPAPNRLGASVHEPLPADSVTTQSLLDAQRNVTVPVGVPANSGETVTDRRSDCS